MSGIVLLTSQMPFRLEASAARHCADPDMNIVTEDGKRLMSLFRLTPERLRVQRRKPRAVVGHRSNDKVCLNPSSSRGFALQREARAEQALCQSEPTRLCDPHV
jgi:hypothetical protein